MNNELLNTLIMALQHSPDNAILRKQIVSELLDLKRWDDVTEHAGPLCSTEHRPFAILALAYAAFHNKQIEKACEYYDEAIKLDPSLEDEDLEAELHPEEAIRMPVNDFEMETGTIRPYAGPRVTFSDLGGMNDVKEQVNMNILYPFQHPEIFAAYGKKVGGGILMYGPPGCGKTYLARATAGELNASFYLLELSDILSMWMGESEKHLNQLFETARANIPAVIFIDEIDALGAKRGDNASSGLRITTTQLLTEMDGMSSDNNELLILGATNEPWSIDPAFRRPGRFDRIIFIPPPDLAARVEILKLHARGRKMASNIPWQAIAEKTEFYSGADLASLIERACESALTEVMRTGKIRDIAMPDFQKALRDTRPSTTEWLRRAKNYVTYANQDGLYDQLAQYLSRVKI